jgi:hypothetical protein
MASSSMSDLTYLDLFTRANLAFDNVNDCTNNPSDGEGGFLSPILYEPIEPSGQVTPGLSINDVLLDPRRKFIKVPEIDAAGKLIGFTCYEKSEFIYYIKTQIVNNIIKNKDNFFEIFSPVTRLLIPLQIIDMLNSLFSIQTFIDAYKDIIVRNQQSYDQMILPTFYYSYENPNNSVNYENILFLNNVYQYFQDNGSLLASHFHDDIAFAKHMINLNLRSYIDNLYIKFSQDRSDNVSRQELAKFIQAQSQFLPFVTFNINSEGNIISYRINFENHPYFMPEFRAIFTGEDVTNFSNRTESRPGVETKSGQSLTHGDIIGVHPSSKQYQDLTLKMRNLYHILKNKKRIFLNRLTLTPTLTHSSSASSSIASSSIAPSSDGNDSDSSAGPFTGRRGGSKKKRKSIRKKKRKKRKTIRKKI